MSDIKRASNFNAEEKKILVEEVERKFNVLYGKFSNTISKARKDAYWEEISKKVSSVRGVKRNSKECKVKWNNLRCDSKSKVAKYRREARKTGGGQNDADEPNDLEFKITALIGKEAIEGIICGDSETIKGKLLYLLL